MESQNNEEDNENEQDNNKNNGKYSEAKKDYHKINEEDKVVERDNNEKGKDNNEKGKDNNENGKDNNENGKTNENGKDNNESGKDNVVKQDNNQNEKDNENGKENNENGKDNVVQQDNNQNEKDNENGKYKNENGKDNNENREDNGNGENSNEDGKDNNKNGKDNNENGDNNNEDGKDNNKIGKDSKNKTKIIKKITKKEKNVYFIASFKENIKIELTLSDCYNLIKKLDKQNNKIIIYYFKNANKKEKIKINQEFDLEIKAPNINYFDYDFKLKDSIDLSYEEKFRIYYMNIFKDKDINSKEFEDFIYSSQLILKNKDEYNFSFYLLIFNAIYNTKFLKEHLELFKLEKITKNIKNLLEEDIAQSKEIFNNIIPNDKIIENENNSKNMKESYYSILLFFNLKYQPDKVIEMFNDENINENGFLYQKFIKFITKFDFELKLPENHIINILKKAESEEVILDLLNYIEKDILKFLQIINKSKLILKEKKIDINNYIDINENIDKTEYLNSILKEIKELENNHNLKMFDFTNSKLIETMLENNKENIENLIILKEIINEIKKSNESFTCKEDVNLLIHEKVIQLIKYGNLTNLDLLNKIDIDEIYKNDAYKSKRTLDIFDGIDISNADKQFLEKWKKMDFKKIFEPKELYDKITSLVTEFKFIEKLYEFFDNDNDDDDDFNTSIENRFKAILVENKDNLNENDIIELIYSMDKNKRKNLKNFLKIIEEELGYENTEKIYINLESKYNDLSDNCKDLISQYLIDGQKSASEISELIKKCNNIKKNILNKIKNDFIIKENYLEDEVENEKENEAHKLLKELKSIIKEKNFSETDYIKNTNEIIEKIKVKLQNNEIKYDTLVNEEKKKKLEERLECIDLKNEISNIESKFGNVNQNINKLIEIQKYFKQFLEKSKNDKINEIQNILDLRKTETLAKIDEEINKYPNYINDYNKAEKVLGMNESDFFINIYKNHKNGNNEEDQLEKAIEEFQSLDKLFEGYDFLDIDDNTLKICFKNLPKDKQGDEIKKLGKILGKENILISELLEKIREKYIFKALLKMIQNYKEQINKNKGEKESCKIDLNKNKEIENCQKELKELNLDENDNGKYKLLNNLNENWEIILILSNDKFKNKNNNGENCVKNCFDLVQKDIKQFDEEFNKVFIKYINKKKNVLNDFIQLIDKSNNNYLYNILFNDDNKIYENFILPLEHINILSENNKTEIDNYQEKWDKLIHQSILKSVEEKKLKNLDLLEMIEKDKIYNDDKYKDSRDLDIFNGIVISEVNNDFFNKWKQMNFKNMFQSNLNGLYDKITSLVEDFKSFEKLFLFFENNDDFDNSVENQFRAILKNKNNINENDIMDIINLIHSMDEKQKKNSEKFLEIIKEELNPEKTEEIYIILETKYANLSVNVKNLIAHILILNKNSAEDISKLINNCNNIKKDILNEIKEDFIIKETFLEDENENEDYKLLKQLNEINIFNENEFIDTNYYKKTKNTIEKIGGILNKNEIKYNTYDDDKKKQNFKKRLEFINSIFSDNRIDDKNTESKFEEIKVKIVNLKTIQDYLKKFSESIEKEKTIQNILNSLKTKNLSEIDNEINHYNDYINDYETAEKVLKKEKNLFFNNIYKNHIEIKDEKKRKNKTLEKFDSLDKLFEDNDFLDIDDNTLKICFENLPKDKQEDEIKKLGKIFGKENILVSELLEKIKEKYIFKALLKIIKNYKEEIDKNKNKNKGEEECCKIDILSKNKGEIDWLKKKLKDFNLDFDEKYEEMLNNLNEHWEIILILSIDYINFDENSKKEDENCVKNCYNFVHKNLNEFDKNLFNEYINKEKEKNVLNDFIKLTTLNYLYDVLFNDNNKNFILAKEYIKILAYNKKTKIKNFEKKWNDLIYKSILKSVEDKKLKNVELLNMIKDYNIYNENICQNLNDDDLKIFNGIDLSSFTQDKYDVFKSVNFEEKFKSISKTFYEKLDLLIIELKNFKIIFYCFNIEVQDQDQNLSPIKQKFKKLLDKKVEQNDYKDLIDLIYFVEDKKLDNGLHFIKETIENNSNSTQIYSGILDIDSKNDKNKLSKELKSYINNFLSKKRLKSLFIYIFFGSIFILLLSFIFGNIFGTKLMPNKEYEPNEINWNIYNISKEAKLEEKQYDYIEVKNQKIQKLTEKEDKIIVGIDFGTISTGYSYVERTDIKKININSKSPNEVETSKDTQNGKKYSERASISLQNYNREELSNINFVKGIKTIFTLDKFNNDNLCYVYPSEYVTNFNIKNVIREYFIMLKKDIIENINVPRNKKDKIKWIISIPTAWKEFNKQIILNAAYESGMSNIKLLYENEAASLSMLNDKYIPEKHKNKNKVFILASLGGYYSNITINEIVDKETIKEKELIKNNAIIENVGVLTIAQEIIQILENIFGKYNVEKAKREDPGEWVKTLKDINEAIRSTNNLDGMEIFKINTVFKKKGEFEYSYKTEDKEKRYIIKNKLDLEFPSGIIGDIIHKNIKIIINRIDNIMNEMKSKRIRIDSMVLTGGLSKNKVVQNEIESKFNSRTTVNYLSSTEYAISKGAVFYGINPNRIKSRISPETLGIRNKENGKDNIEILVKRGQDIDNYSMVKFIKPSSKKQDKIQINVYATDSENLHEDDFIGRLMIYLDQNKKDGVIQLNINYDTVLSFSAMEYDNKKEIKTKFEIVK